MKRRNSKLPPLETMHPYFIKHIISMLKIRNQQFSTCCVLPTAFVTTALQTFTFTAPQVVRMIAIELLNQICILRGSQRSFVAEQDEKINRILSAKGQYDSAGCRKENTTPNRNQTGRIVSSFVPEHVAEIWSDCIHYMFRKYVFHILTHTYIHVFMYM